jgi:prepilin-type N-terminal cleavage/methylation domain-containing protein
VSTRGYTMIELLVALAIAAVLLLGLAGAVRGGLAAEAERSERAALAAGAQFALERMTAAVRATPRLILPLADDPRTGVAKESVREQSVPPLAGREHETAVLAVALDRSADRDADGVADADNDADGLYDEDHHTDSTDDDHSGIALVDDDHDGMTDETVLAVIADDDEDGVVDDDPVNGSDDDGDGGIDEDPPADMNGDGYPGVAAFDDDGDGSADEGHYSDDDEDGVYSEDGLDPVVFRLVGGTLVERVPLPWDENGDGGADAGDYVEQALAEGVAYLRFERVAASRGELVEITLELAAPGGATLRLTTRQRVGGGS